MSLLAVHAGTTGVTASVVDRDGRVAAREHRAVDRSAPRPGWVEHPPEQVWQAAVAATRGVLDTWPGSPDDLRGVGVAGAGDTVLLWDRETLGSPRPAIGAADRRAEDLCARLGRSAVASRVAGLTGLPPDLSRTGPRLAWLAEQEPHTWALVGAGRYATGTLASYLVARMTRGTWHLTDVSHASRSQLFDLDRGDWSAELCAVFGVPLDALPELVPSWGGLATTDPRSFAGLELTIGGIADEPAATLFGRRCLTDGESTAGPGGTLLTCTGSVVRRAAGQIEAALPLAAWRGPDGRICYATEAGSGQTPGTDDAVALGAAYLAGLGCGVWASPAQLPG